MERRKEKYDKWQQIRKKKKVNRIVIEKVSKQNKKNANRREKESKINKEKARIQLRTNHRRKKINK